MAKKSAEDLVDELVDGLADRVAEIKKRAVSETRKNLAGEIEAQFLGRARRTFYGGSADDSVRQALAEFPSLRDPRLQALVERFTTDGVSEDFRAGILFAARLFADEDYEA